MLLKFVDWMWFFVWLEWDLVADHDCMDFEVGRASKLVTSL